MTDKSPNLEIVSNGSERTAGPERRRLPRLGLSREQFRHTQNGKIFSATDLSAEGMALRILDPNDLLLFPVATVFEGVLNLRGEKNVLLCKVRHIGHESVGCEFKNISESAQNAIARFLDPATLGRELKLIPSSESGTLWYHGPSGTDLLFKRSTEGQYRQMTLYVLGSFIQWTEEAGISTGRLRSANEQSETRGVLRFEMLLLEEDPEVDLRKLGVAKTLILSSNLAEDFKNWCVQKL